MQTFFQHVIRPKKCRLIKIMAENVKSWYAYINYNEFILHEHDSLLNFIHYIN